MKYTTTEIQEMLRTANCMSEKDFMDFMISMNPKVSIGYVQEKWSLFKKSSGGVDFIFTLDTNRLEQFFTFLHNRLIATG